MKKILFSLVALVCSMSMNAQQIKLMKGNTVVATYSAAQVDNVVFEEAAINPFLPGSFSVSATKTVKFTKSNLYWDGSAFHFEAKPTDYPTTRTATGENIHVGHFFWTKTAAASYAATYDDGTNETTDHFFADGSDDAHKLTVDGVSGLYVLSKDEWTYLLNTRTSAADLKKKNVTVTDGTNTYSKCFIIAPDNFTGTIAETYTLEELDAAGLLCLPPAGYFVPTDGNFYDQGSDGHYCSSTAISETAAQTLRFAYLMGRTRSFGSSVRAVLAE